MFKLFFDPFRLDDACVHQWTRSPLDQVMACQLFGAKPLPESMLIYCRLNLKKWSFMELKSNCSANVNKSGNYQVALWATWDWKCCCHKQFLVVHINWTYGFAKPWDLVISCTTSHKIWLKYWIDNLCLGNIKIYLYFLWLLDPVVFEILSDGRQWLFYHTHLIHLLCTKWLPFRRQYFQIHFHEWKILYFE